MPQILKSSTRCHFLPYEVAKFAAKPTSSSNMPFILSNLFSFTMLVFFHKSCYLKEFGLVAKSTQKDESNDGFIFMIWHS
jgi:hypothetical protein